MLCPWCLHYGAADADYAFDAELYCSICAQQLPQSDERWTAAFRVMTPEMLTFIEEELNRIAVSKSGMREQLREAMGHGIDALAALRESGAERRMPLGEGEYVRWVRFACTYYMPNIV